MLMRYGLDAADRDGLDVYLESTPAALEFYKRLGFDALDEIPLLEGKYVLTAMMRKATNSA